MANLINIFNPECIILSCPDLNIATDEILVGAMHQEIKQHLFSQMGKDLQFFTVEQLGYECVQAHSLAGRAAVLPATR